MGGLELLYEIDNFSVILLHNLYPNYGKTYTKKAFQENIFLIQKPQNLLNMWQDLVTLR